MNISMNPLGRWLRSFDRGFLFPRRVMTVKLQCFYVFHGIPIGVQTYVNFLKSVRFSSSSNSFV